MCDIYLMYVLKSRLGLAMALYPNTKTNTIINPKSARNIIKQQLENNISFENDKLKSKFNYDCIQFIFNNMDYSLYAINQILLFKNLFIRAICPKVNIRIKVASKIE